MAKTKKKHSGKPRGMNYADMLARKRMIRERMVAACDEACRVAVGIMRQYQEEHKNID